VLVEQALDEIPDEIAHHFGIDDARLHQLGYG
jgi:predicted Zn-dependent protease with MMP-like domain